MLKSVAHAYEGSTLDGKEYGIGASLPRCKSAPLNMRVIMHTLPGVSVVIVM